MKPVNPQPG